MLQVAMSGGEVRVVEVPEPVVRPGTVLVRTSHSLISAGTESASIGSGGRRENLVLKAIRNPALVMKVVDRVASHGLKSTAELVKTRVSTEMPSGYSCAGVVVDVGEGVVDIHVGDRVACAGAGYANHAAVNVVPRNLVARIPDAVSFEEAAFATLGAIALQGVRRAEPGLGDRVAVLGLGLLGQITAQMLHAAGAVVIGVDVRPDRVARAQALGLDQGFTVAERDFVAGVLERTEGRGADAVIVTAAGGDAGLLNKAFEACRRKGRVVLVGDVPIRIQRDKIYKKEIDFLISTSYGPGRYDPAYEEKGHDYPFGYVRWTEGRNLEEVLRQVAAGSLRVKPLVDATHPVENAGEAYASLASENRPIGILLDYHLDAAAAAPRAVSYRPIRRAASPPKDGAFGVGVVGYGGYFRSMLLPLLKAHPGFSLASACARSGLTVRAAVENGRLRPGNDGLPRGPRRPLGGGRVRGHPPRPPLRGRARGGRGGQGGVRREADDHDGEGRARARRGRRAPRDAPDRGLQPPLLPARRAAQGARSTRSPRPGRSSTASTPARSRRSTGSSTPWRAAAGSSARASTSSTCSASSPAPIPCASSRSLPRAGSGTRRSSPSSSRTARSAP